MVLFAVDSAKPAIPPTTGQKYLERRNTFMRAANRCCQVGCRGDGDCPAASRCQNMQCTTPSPQPGVGTIPGEGRKCNPPDGSRPPGWATDSHGKPLGACPQGTVCSNRGFCQRLLQ